MSKITTIGLDIAKNYFQIHGVNENGKAVFKKKVTRARFMETMTNLPKCLVGMEACGGAHYWANRLMQLGFDVKLMSPRKVKTFVENHKNDAKDAEACAEAVTRGNMLFVPVKNGRQLEIQGIHRIRSFYIKERTALMNMTRGLLYEMGIIAAQGQTHLITKLTELTADDFDELSAPIKATFRRLYDDLLKVNKEVEHYTKQIEDLAKKEESCIQLQTINGIGPITATAIVAKIGNGSEFKNGRELSAYLGLVPKQNSSGGKQQLLGISKHGDRYIRQLLIHGGRAAAKAALQKDKNTGGFVKQDAHSIWIRKLVDKVGMNKTSVAVANKNARFIIALQKNGTTFNAAMAH